LRGVKTSSIKKEQIKALLYVNPEISQRELVKNTDLPLSTINGIVNDDDFIDKDNFERYRTEQKISTIKEAWNIAKIYLEHLKEPAVIEKANAYHSAIVSGTMIDKAQLLAGDPTVIVEKNENIKELVVSYEATLEEIKRIMG
jgi:hypothetical protein